MKDCDPILDMRITQEQLRAMYERNPALAKRNPISCSTPPKVTEMYPGAPPGDHWGFPHKPNKYRNIKVEYQGMKFDSKKELRCWQELELRQKAGEIRSLNRQVRYDLIVNNKIIGSLTVDFTFEERCDHGAWAIVIADAKSPPTRKETAYRLRKKIWEALYAPLVIREL